ncbi:MAG: arginine--tRNA ligase [Thermoplasmatota archaeon]
MHPLDAFRDEVNRIIQATWNYETQVPELETPPDATMGDLGLPCFPLARELRKAPPAIAGEMAEAMQPSGWVREIRAVGPYVNFFLDSARLAEYVASDVDGALTPPAKPGRILLEHTSANPNGPLHVGRARNPILGDTLGRILRAAGHDVETQYYMDNLGRQVALLYKGKQTFCEEDLPAAARDKIDHVLVRYYQAANERKDADPAYAEEVKQLVAQLETADVQLLADVREVYEACFSGMRESLSRLGVDYDSIKDESDLVAGGDVDATIERLKQSPRAGQEDDGANYLDLSAELEGNKSTKFFFTRKDQTSVYATRDVAYHKWKAEQVGEGLLLNVLGEDHRLQSLQVSIALEELGHRRPEVVFYAFVSLPDGKMSTRANRVVFLDDLLDEAHALAAEAVRSRREGELDEAELDAIAEAVGVAAIRFNIAKVQPEKPIAFRWEEALDFDGDSAPYLMYAHARAASLLARAAEAGIEPSIHELGDGEARLAKVLAQFVPEVEAAAARRAPHRFCAYASRLAGAFNEYYRDHPVLTCDDAQAQQTRLAMVGAAKKALAKALDALGIPVLDRM